MNQQNVVQLTKISNAQYSGMNWNSLHFLQSAKEWQEVFWITFAILFGGTVIFCMLMSGERQEWDITESKLTDDSMESNRTGG